MVHHVYSVTARDGGWAVDHIGKTLEVYATREEAEAAAERLAKLTQVSGHDAELVVRDEGGRIETDDIYRRVEK